jgi:hypothetical protein
MLALPISPENERRSPLVSGFNSDLILWRLIHKKRRQITMSGPSVLDKTYHIIIKSFVATGHAPHYTEIASELGMSMEEGRKILHDLMSVGIPGTWLFPNTDYISSFAPFSNLPTQYRISIDGERKWFGQ